MIGDKIAIKKALTIYVHHKAINRGQYCLISKKSFRFKVMHFLSDYQLRWWRIPMEERACRKTRLGGDDYPLRTSAPPPASF